MRHLRLMMAVVALVVMPTAGRAAEKPPIREWGYITLNDGAKLAYVAYRPDDGHRYPVLLNFSPYSEAASEAQAAAPYLEHGYIYAAVDVRGTGCSTGALSVFDPQLAEDGAQAVEFIGSRSWSSGAVGMVGMSYRGHSQIFKASRHPKYLKAIAPGAISASAYREVFRPAGMFAPAYVGGWAYGASSDAGAKRRVAWGDNACDPLKAAGALHPAFNEVKDHPFFNDWWKARSLESVIDKVEVPALFVQSWQDYMTQVSGATHLYERTKAPKRLVLQTGGHFAYTRKVSQDEVFRWMDHWVKGVDNGVDKDLPVKVLWEVRNVDGVATPGWTSSYPAWPIPAAKPLTLYLTPVGTLSPVSPAATADQGARDYAAPASTEFMGDNTQFAVRPMPEGALFYRSEPVADDTTILGFTQATLYVGSSQPDTDIMVVLHDIDEAGNTTYLQRDFVRTSLRALDPATSTSEEQLRSFDHAEPLQLGNIYELTLSMPPVGQVIRKGHRIEFAIMSPPTIGTPRWGFALIDQGGRNIVYQSAKYPSHLTLSTIPGERARAPQPACGTVEYQPCRKPAAAESLGR